MKKRIYLQELKKHQTRLIVWLIAALFLLPSFAISQQTGDDLLFDGAKVSDFPTDTEAIWEMIHNDLNGDQKTSGGYPPIWDVPVNTGTIHGYIVQLSANPRVNDIQLQPGDWIGGFYLLNGVRKCGGARMWTGTENVILTLFGDDNTTPVKDGFSGGELIEFRFFLWQTQKEYIVTITSYYVAVGYVTNGRWYPTSLSMFTNIKAVTNMDFYINTSDNPICINNQVTLSAEEFVGTGGPYTYSWSSSPSGFNHNVKNPPPVVLDVTTDFFLTVTDPTNTSNHQIKLIVNDYPTANAGSDGTICENQSFTVNGTSTNALNVEWSTSGDGLFNNPANASAVYTPGINDKTTGSVELSFTAEPYSPCQVEASDNLTLQISPLPTVNAGPDMSACGTQPVDIFATGGNYNIVQWTTSGSGTFSNPNSLQTIYNPSNADVSNGGVTLSVCVSAISPCASQVCDNLLMSFLAGPTCSAPTIIRRCEGVAFNLNGSASNNFGVEWTTQGDGTFANPYALQTVYTPGPQDIANFGTIVTLTAFAIPPCQTHSTKNVTLFIQQLPQIVTFGPNTDFACKDSYLQLAAQVTEYTSVSWTRTGDGTFSQTNVLNPKYYPGPNDKANGYFTLTLTAAPKTYCQTGTSVSKTIQIIDNPGVQISTLPNQLVCAEPPFQLQATASSYSNLLWTTTGDGIFSNPGNLSTSYIPGNNDMNTGANIKLTLTAAPVAPCLVSAESFIYTSFQRPPSANAGADATICENQTYQLSGSAISYSSVLWQTSGTGTFNNSGNLQAIYTPSAQDALAGSVVLTLISQPVSPCTMAASDQMTLTVQRLSTANAGSDATICENSTHSLNGSAERYSSVLWSTSGTGNFSYAASLNPVYTPSATDKLAGSLTLTLTSQPLSPCAVAATDIMTLTIQRLSAANAGADATICENVTHSLSGAAERYASVSWTTSGTGTFANNGTLTPVYTPSTADKNAGSVVITLTAQPLSPCAVAATDQMTLNIQRLATAFAGNDATICENGTRTLNGSATRYSSTLWTTSGSGAFSNPALLNPVYTPSNADKTAGSVVLTLTAQPISPCSISASDQMILTIQQLSTADAGNDATICENSTQPLNGSAVRYSSVLWSTSGTGTFSNSSILNPVYTPSTADKNAGSVDITLTAQPLSPCAVAATDQMTLAIQRLSTANAGADATICENLTHSLSGTAERYASVSWSTSGTGTFANNGTLTPDYTPSSIDKTAGSVMITLMAQPLSPCDIAAEDQMVLHIQQLSTANAGDDDTICENSTHSLNGSAVRYSSVLWSTSGTGNFSNAASLNPVYTPSATDKLAGSLTLTLTSQPLSPCAVAATDIMTLTIQRLSTANAGADATICENVTHSLSGAAERYASVSWTTSGTGTFANNGTLTPVYTPSTADKNAGSVVITLTAQPLSPCAVAATDQMTLTIQRLATAFAGSDATICENGTRTLNGSATRYSSTLWTTSGSGAFSNPALLNPVYTPSNADKTAGSVVLTLTAQPISPCSISASDQMVLTIQQLSTANAGIDATICENSTHSLNGSAVRYSSVLWSTSGTGNFSNAASLNPVYTPSAADKLAGSLTLTLTSQPLSPCAVAATDIMTLTIQRLSTANAGADASICESDNYTLNGNAERYASVSWSTSGTGTFTNNGTLTPVYTPSTADKNAGSVVITLTAQPMSPCAVAATDQMTLTIQRLATAFAGSDATICENGTRTLNGAASRFSSILWTSSGTGTFSNPAILNPVYTPSNADKTAGTIVLTLTAQPISPCSVSASDQMVLTIQQLSTANAGIDATICENSTHSLNGSAVRYSSVLWSTSGTGNFSNATSLNPVYTPSAADKLAGSLTLTLTSQPLSPCAVAATDQMILTINNLSTANAGNDVLICSSETYQLSGMAQNYSAIQWSTMGTGTFNNPGLLNPVYTFSQTDIAAGSVVLHMTALPLEPCQLSDTDDITLTIEMLTIMNDQVVDQEAFTGSQLLLAFEVESSGSGSYTWYFNDQLIENANSSTLVVNNVSQADAGFYQCFFTSNCGMVSSNKALVQVLQISTHQMIVPFNWSGISSFVTPDNPSMDNIFSEITASIELVQDYNGVYWPGQNINTLGDWSVTRGYRIKMNNTSELNITGLIRYPMEELSVANGWSILPVNTPCAVDVEDQFTSLSAITMIKEIAGVGLYWPAYNINTLNQLLPGKAYEIFNSSAQPVAIKYPFCDELPVNPGLKTTYPEVVHPWNQIQKSPISHIFGFLNDATDQLKPGDIIGIFTQSGICSGVAQAVDAGKIMVLTAFSTDPVSAQATGFEPGEVVEFRMFRPATGEEFSLNIQYADGTSLQTFSPNGVTLINGIEFLATNIENNTSLSNNFQIDIFPNPTTGMFDMHVTTDQVFAGKIVILSATGQAIQKIDFEHDGGVSTRGFDLSGKPAGIYYIRIIGDNVLKMKKLILK